MNFAIQILTVLAFGNATAEGPAEALEAPHADASASSTTASQTLAPRRRFGGFVEAGWRVMGLGGHVSNGPSFAAGALLGRYFLLGFSGFARPGPINPVTFRWELPDGDTYRGKSTLQFRSDGAAAGLMLGPRYDFRRVPLSLELPIMVGFGGFGFYLHGDDRNTPDGRRVSEWENELLDGKDSDTANLVLDVGLRLLWTPRKQPHVRPFLSANYTLVTPFDTAVLQDYSGFSGALGLQFGVYPDP